MTGQANRIGPRLHHVGVVVASPERVTELLELLGLREGRRGYVAAFQALCIFTDGNGATPIEFVVPSGGQLAKFNRGAGGLHHIALEVDDLGAVTTELGRRGMALSEPAPIRGAGGFRCNFLSPVHTRGLIVEFIEVDEPQCGLPLDPAQLVTGALQAAMSAQGTTA